MSLRVYYEVLNQKGSPALYTDTLANRPAFGFQGRLFVSTDSGQIFEDTGSAWTLVADAGVGGGTLSSVCLNGNTTATGIVITAGGLSSNSITNTGTTAGSILFAGTGGLQSQDNTNLFWDNTTKYLGIGPTGTPTAPLDIHNGIVNVLMQLNATSTNNSLLAFLNANVGKWRIGNSYNSGANDFIIFNNTTSSISLLIDVANNITSIGSYQSNKVSTTNGTPQFVFKNGTNGTRAVLGLIGTEGTNTGSDTFLYNYLDDDTAVPVFRTTRATGAISFSSNLTALSLIKSGGTSAQILAADGSVITAGTNITISGGTISSSGGGGMAIGGSITSATAGSVLFAGTSGVLAQNNASFFWDNTNTRLLIGTTTTTDARIIAVGNSSNHALFVSQPVIYAGSYRIMRLYANSNVILNVSSGNGTDLELNNQQNGFISFSTNSAERIRFTSGGNILIGTTTDSGFKLDVSGTLRASGVVTLSNLSGTGSRAVIADANGVLSAPVSDISVKQNITSIGYGLKEISKMNPVWFNYTDQYKNYGQERQNGNIAQEMAKIIPEAVFITPSTGKMGINYDQLHAVYIKAIQELKSEIEQLKKN